MAADLYLVAIPDDMVDRLPEQAGESPSTGDIRKLSGRGVLCWIGNAPWGSTDAADWPEPVRQVSVLIPRGRPQVITENLIKQVMVGMNVAPTVRHKSEPWSAPGVASRRAVKKYLQKRMGQLVVSVTF